MNKPVVHSSSIVHENPWYKIRKDELTWANGKPGEYYVAEFPGASTVVCIRDGKLLTVRFYRHTFDLESIEIPCGRIDLGESPEEAARRELREEGGVEASSLEFLGSFYTLVGVAKNLVHVYYTNDVIDSATQHEDAEHGMQVQWIAIDEWENMIANGQVLSGETLTPWALYRAKYPR